MGSLLALVARTAEVLFLVQAVCENNLLRQVSHTRRGVPWLVVH